MRTPTPCLTLAVLAVISGCESDTPSDPPPESAPLDDGLAIQSTDLGTLPQTHAILGRDGAYSARFQGYSFWVYGDSFLDRINEAGRTFISNTWSYTVDETAADGISGFQERLDPASAPTLILQETPSEAAFNNAHYGDLTCQVPPCGAHWSIWPASIVVDPASNHALIFYSVQSVDASGRFQGVGTSVAQWDDFNRSPVRPTFDPPIVPDHPDLLFGRDEPTFGSASLIDNGMLYAYGCGNSLNGLDKGCRLARVNPATVRDRSTWMFYAGHGVWSSSLSEAVPVFDGLDILSVSWNEYLQRFIAVYSGLFSENVMVRVSRAPEGPWSGERVAFTARAPANGTTHDAQAHSEFDANGGQTIFVTYSRDLGDFTSEVRLVRVDLRVTGALP